MNISLNPWYTINILNKKFSDIFYETKQGGFSGKADLSGVGRRGKHIGFLDEGHIGGRQVGGRLVQNIVDADHGLPVMFEVFTCTVLELASAP